MNAQVLTTKLYPPLYRPNLVARPRLVERLNAGLQASKQLFLISATAGFGKTTLASEWIKEGELHDAVAWISLDNGDNDPNWFLCYLISALQHVDPEIGVNLLPILQSSQPVPFFELVVQLINQIAASDKKMILMLDDYHLIISESVHQVIQLIIERQPNQMKTVILTREDPPLSLPRLRARSQVTEIRERDLRFTLPEAHAFMVGAMGLDLSVEDVTRLEERTEGWAAGMQLAALALEESSDEEERHNFIKDFTGSNRFIVDYLISEILQRQPETVRQFLMSTSIMERFCDELCDQVVFDDVNASRSGPILDSLSKRNMFLVPLDNQRRWYRYHHLFNEMLSHSLQRSTPDQISALCRRASQWFEAKGFVPEAVKYALGSKDWDFARGLLDRHAMHLLFQGQGSLVIGWFREIQKAYLQRAPEICIFYAWALVLTFRNDYLDAVEEKLRMAEQAVEILEQPSYVHVGEPSIEADLKDWVTGQACVIRSQILLGRFNSYVDPQELIALSLKGLELLPEVEKAIRSTCKINLAHAQLMQNNPAEAQIAFEQALPLMLEANNYLGSVTNIFYQARLAFYLGHLDRAEMLCQQWKTKFAEMAGSTGRDSRDIPATRGLDIVQSLLLLESNQLEEAEHLLVQALELLGWASWMEFHGFVILARLRFLRGNYAGAQETLLRMSRLGPQHAACAEALQVLFDTKRSLDDFEVRARGETWGKKHPPDQTAPFALGIGPYHCDAEYFCNLAWAHLQIALGHPQAASIFVEPALESARKQHLAFRIVELSYAQTLIYQALGNTPAALSEFENALEIAEACGYARVFDEGPALDILLNQVIERKTHSQYARQLLEAFYGRNAEGKSSGSTSRKKSNHPMLVDPLSEREIEVLRLIADGHSNSQIAGQLYISQGTVKRHITNMYGKLSVQTRTQAVAKAREIGLLA